MYGITTHDATTYGVVAAGLAVVTAIATFVRRQGRLGWIRWRR